MSDDWRQRLAALMVDLGQRYKSERKAAAVLKLAPATWAEIKSSKLDLRYSTLREMAFAAGKQPEEFAAAIEGRSVVSKASLLDQLDDLPIGDVPEALRRLADRLEHQQK